MPEKIVGYTLLIVGLTLIIISLFNVYQTFTGQIQPFSLVHSSGLSLNLNQTQSVQVMSAQDIDQVTNLTLSYLLFSFLVTVGFKVSTLGTQLLRPIAVRLQAKGS